MTRRWLWMGILIVSLLDDLAFALFIIWHWLK